MKPLFLAMLLAVTLERRQRSDGRVTDGVARRAPIAADEPRHATTGAAGPPTRADAVRAQPIENAERAQSIENAGRGTCLARPPSPIILPIAMVDVSARELETHPANDCATSSGVNGLVRL